jgi:hypothetical protein
MANRVLLGNLGSSNYGLKISKEGEDVLTTAAKNLVFDSTKPRTGQIYAGGSTSSTSSTLTWTSGSKPTLTYIPIYFIFEQGTKVYHQERVDSNQVYDLDFYNLNNQGFPWELTNTSITPKETAEGGWIRQQTAGARRLSSTDFQLFYQNRTSNATSFVVLRIPCAYGFMGSTYIDASGSSQTFGSTNHPTFGNSQGLWT